MKWNNSLNWIVASSVAAFLAAASSAHAIPKGPCDVKPEVCCDEPKPGPFAFAFPKDIELNCPKDFYVNVTGLALQAKEGGLEFAIRNTNGTSLPIQSGEVLGLCHDDHDYGYNPGIRVGLGFYVHHDAWSLDFDWTWLNVTNYKTYTASNGGILMPIWLPPLPNDPSWRSVAAAWNVKYNTLDARLGKPYHVSRYLILRPHFGLRGGWIDQQFSVHYGGLVVTQYGTVHDASNDFWGFGARAGLESEWVIGKGWQLFGNIAASMLFGKFTINQNVPLGLGAANQGFDLDYDFYQNVPNMDIQLGIAWNKYFNRDRYRVGIAAAYEFHQWWNQNNLRRFYGTTTSTTTYQWQNDTVSRGDFSLNGFSLRVQLDI